MSLVPLRSSLLIKSKHSRIRHNTVTKGRKSPWNLYKRACVEETAYQNYWSRSFTIYYNVGTVATRWECKSRLQRTQSYLNQAKTETSKPSTQRPPLQCLWSPLGRTDPVRMRRTILRGVLQGNCQVSLAFGGVKAVEVVITVS